MQGTREKLIETARQLFAERGVLHVSLREITRAAGQGNVSALQYHFGDRDGLLQAVLDPHHREVDARRQSLLDDVEARGGEDLRALTNALVRPPAALLQEPAGREYLRIVAQIIHHAALAAHREAFLAALPSFGRWRNAVARFIPAEGARLHRRFTAYQLACIELGRRAELPGRDDRLFTSHLADLTGALLVAPVSAETRRLLVERGPDQRVARSKRSRSTA